MFNDYIEKSWVMRQLFDWIRPQYRRTPIWRWFQGPVDRYSLLVILHAAHESRLPLVPLLTAYAEENRDLSRGAIQRLVHRLQMGTPLVSALEQTPGILNEDQVLAIRYGTQTGTLGAVYHDLLETEKFRPGLASERWRDTATYWLTIGIVIVLILLFLNYFIGPTFKKIFDEMSFRLTPALLLLIRVSDWFQFRLGGILLGIAVFLILIQSRTIRKLFASLIRPLSERRKTTLKLRRHARIFQLLSIGLSEGRSIGSLLSTLAKYHPVPSTRQQLLIARNELEQGTDPWQSMKHAGLLSDAEAMMLFEARESKDMAWLFKSLSQRNLVREQERSLFALAIVHPVVIITLGLIVMWICVAYFGSLTRIVELLS